MPHLGEIGVYSIFKSLVIKYLNSIIMYPPFDSNLCEFNQLLLSTLGSKTSLLPIDSHCIAKKVFEDRFHSLIQFLVHNLD